MRGMVLAGFMIVRDAGARYGRKMIESNAPRRATLVAVAFLSVFIIGLFGAACGGADDSPVAKSSTSPATAAGQAIGAAGTAATAAPNDSPVGSSVATAVATARPAGTVPGPSVTTSSSDPFDYCASARDRLHPDGTSGYSGPVEPAAVVRALEIASGAPAGALKVFADQNAVYWRCMGGAVYGCSPGANLQCWDVDTGTAPTKAMQDYCAANPGAFIPAFVTGHTTIYDWTCVGTTATRGKQLVELDAAGLNARIWYKLARP